jgi:FAD/FMN-containing dehydrogenase
MADTWTRRFVLLAALATVSCGGPSRSGSEAPAAGGVRVNDLHSRLNETTVREVVTPGTVAELAEFVRRAGREGLPISISGGRHAMGGQQFAAGALHVDMSRLDRVVALDRARGIVTVEAGIQWPKLIDELIAMQAGDAQPWSIVQKQTGADNLSIGGALAANIHGRGLALPPFVSDVEAFRLMRADGNEVEVTRESDRELFSLVAGGYGLFGVVTTVDLRLQRRVKLRRHVEVVNADRLAGLFSERIASGALYGDFQFKTDDAAADFMTTGVFATYAPAPLDAPMPVEQRALSDTDWNDLFVLAHLDKAKAFAAYRDYYLGTSGQVYWSDTHQLSYYGDFEAALMKASPSYPAGSLMITEVYVPRHRLGELMTTLAGDFRTNQTNLVYGTVRLIERDTDSFLPWATEDYACVVMNLRVTHSPEGLEKARREFQLVIDRALERGGSFFLTYHRWARKEQILAAYPKFVEFLRLKRRYDPEERFQSEWYRHYRTMFASEIGAE